MANSWANVAAGDVSTPTKETEPSLAGVREGAKCAVLDASAIIGSDSIRNLTDALYTTEEVFTEIQDKHSKQLLSSVPGGIIVQEPTAASVAAVTAFARTVGETHALSRADLHLIALAHSLHTHLHGESSLNKEPEPARPVTRGKHNSRGMPGWGAVGGRWEDMDRMEEAEKAALEQAQGQAEASRVAAQIQELNLRAEPEQPSTPSQNQEAAHGAPSEQGLQNGKGDPRTGTGQDDGGQWEVAAVSQNAARRHRRKQAKRANYAASLASAHAQSNSNSLSPQHNSTAAASTWEEQGEASLPDDSHAQNGAADGGEIPDDGLQEDGEGVSESEGSEVSSSQGEGDTEGHHCPGQEALVSISTADFAMQNVILQLGLKLVSPDGRRIRRISRFALRCSACFKVTKEVERVFCPTCGNAALQKVEVVIDEKGAEQFGVRKRHIIRGTRFSIPKPKGGKNSHDPILREDVMMQRLPKRKDKTPSADPFAPEYNANTWHSSKQGYAAPTIHKGAAAALASWKHNPNERHMARTNRRK